VKTWSQDKMMAFIERNHQQANRYHFTHEKDIVRYLSLSVVLGEAFHQTDWAQAYLNHPSIIGTQSPMDRLYQHATELLEVNSV